MKGLHKYFAIAFSLLCGALTVCAYQIDLPDDAISSEKTAKAELEMALEKMGLTEDGLPAFHLGQSENAAAVFGVSWDALKPDQILMKMTNEGIYLSGARPRGTLYAVYEFLERCGVRFWTDDVTSYPHMKALPFHELDESYAPPFFMRGMTASALVRDNRFGACMRNNGTGWGIKEEYGGHISIWGWCHTFERLIPPGQYFKKHPEWFSMINGERVENGQLCLSNQEMRRQLTETAKGIYRDRRGSILSVSINDNDKGCQCDECKKLDAAYGGPSGTLIWFVNQVAADLKKEYPEILIDTLAYLHTAPPPKNIVPDDSVLVRLCFIGGNFAFPLDSPANKVCKEQLEGWSSITRRMSAWTYEANFNNKYILHPNIRNFAADLRFMRDHHVCTVFEQGTPGSLGFEDFAELRAYLVTKLMWNPDLDQQKLTEEFVRGFYGEAAAPHLLAVLAEIDREVGGNPNAWSGIECATTSPWQTLESLLRCHRHFEDALKATENDPIHGARVRKTSLSTAYSILTRREATRWCIDKGALSELDMDALLRRTIAWSREAGYEKMGFDDFAARLEKIVGPTEEMAMPEIFRDISTDDFSMIPYPLFTIKCQGIWNWIVDDPAASLGKSVMFTGDVPTWLLEAPCSLPDYRGTWDVYVELRCETDDAEATALSMPFYDWGASHETPGLTVKAKDIAGKEFKLLKAATLQLTPSTNIIFFPNQNKNIKIYVDRVFFVRHDRD